MGAAILDINYLAVLLRSQREDEPNLSFTFSGFIMKAPGKKVGLKEMCFTTSARVIRETRTIFAAAGYLQADQHRFHMSGRFVMSWVQRNVGIQRRGEAPVG